MNRCVIVTSGPMGPYEPLGSLLRPDDFILCADGGLDHAERLGLAPSVVIGDFDSVSRPPEGPFQVLKFRKEKDETDTVLAIDYALGEGYREFLILGGLRGRLDHTVANFSALLHLHRSGGTGVIADAENEVRMLLAGEMHIPRREGFYVSVFPFGEMARGVTERGMKYALTGATLTNSFPLGVSNEFSGPEALISVENGPLLIILSKECHQNEGGVIE